MLKGVSSFVRRPSTLFLLFAICLLVRSPSFWIPLLDIDESQFALFANTLLEGGRPYIDSVDTKPLGIYWFFAACFWLFGKNDMIAVHIVTAFVVFLTAVFCGKCAEKLGGRSALFWAALFYIVFTTTYTPKFLSTSIVLIMRLPLTLSMFCLFLWEEKGKRLWLFLAGLLFGVGCLFKYQAGLRFLLVFIFLFFLSKQSRKPLVDFLCFAVGAALVGASFVSYLHGIGVWKDFLLWNFQGSIDYMQASFQALNVFKQIFVRVGSFILSTLFLWIFGLKELKRFRGEDPRKLLISLWFLLSVVPVSIGLRFYGHYFIHLLPSLSILAALAWAKSAQDKRWLGAGLVLPALLAFVARIFMGPVHDFFGDEYIERYKPVAQYVRKITPPKDSIYVWGFASPIYFYADRRPASRFLWNDWHTGRVGGGSNVAESGRAIETFETDTAWQMLFEDLQKNKPLYFLDTAPGNYHDYGKFPVSRYPRLHQYLKDRYIFVERRFGVDFYRRKQL